MQIRRALSRKGFVSVTRGDETEEAVNLRAGGGHWRQFSSEVKMKLKNKVRIQIVFFYYYCSFIKKLKLSVATGNIKRKI